MIKKEYLITLLELFTYRISRVWEEITNNDLSFDSNSDFLTYLNHVIKDKRKKILFSQIDIQKAVQNTKKIIEYCNNNERVITIISFEDKEYPDHKMCSIPKNEKPIILYGMGNIELLHKDSIAIIGSRNTDQDYFIIGVELGKLLSSKYTIISGLALGSDSAAHKGALLNNGNTIAILANGLHTIYPKENKDLANQIFTSGGLLLSEYPPFSVTQRHFFAQRDRLQAAFSKAIIVVETGVKSGTMITMNYAREYSKKILVIEPFENSNDYNDLGNKSLIKESDIHKISNNNLYLKDISEIIELDVNEVIKFEIVYHPHFKSYRLDGKEYGKIPKEYKEISRDNKFVTVELNKQ